MLAWEGGGVAWEGGSIAFEGGSVAWEVVSVAWEGGSVALEGGSVAWGGGSVALEGGGVAWEGGSVAWEGGSVAWEGGGVAWEGGSVAWEGGSPGHHYFIDNPHSSFPLNLPLMSEKKSAVDMSQRPIKYICTFSNTIADVMSNRGWEEVSSDSEDWDIVWADREWIFSELYRLIWCIY